MGYTCIKLSETSSDFLVGYLKRRKMFPHQWKPYFHHMTLNMERPRVEHEPFLGKSCVLVVDGFGEIPGRVCAFRVQTAAVVECGTLLTSVNKTPHITAAVNVDRGAKPRESNDIVRWSTLEIPYKLDGTLLYMP